MSAHRPLVAEHFYGIKHLTCPVSCAFVLQILSCGKQLQVWSGKAGAATYYDMIARDKEIVKVVLLLTGSIEGTKESVLEYISSFDKYKFLWQKDLATEYAAFMATSPSLEVGSLCLL